MPVSDPLSAAIIALNSHRFEDVVRLVEPLLHHREAPVRARALLMGAQSVLALGDAATALQMVQMSVRQDPTLGPAWEFTGRILLDAGHPTAAEQAWLKGAQHAPSHTPCWLALAELLESRNARAAAASLLQQAVLRNPTRVDLAHRFVQVLLDQGAIQAVLKALAPALARFPRHPGLRVQAARARYLSGETDEAMQELTTALSLDPRDPIARTLRAQYRLLKRDQTGALEDAKEVLATRPNDPNARMVRAQVALLDRRPEAALADLNVVLNQADHLAEETRGEAHIHRGTAFEALTRFPEALADFVTGQAGLTRSALARAAEPERYLAEVTRRRDALVEGSPMLDAARGWSTTVPDTWPLADNPPVFVFGFPRSGTTLVENILGAHPRLVATDERNILQVALSHHADAMEGTPLDKLTDAQRVVLREKYARQARAFAPSTLRVVDKVPLNLIHTAFIRRVFPDAPILVVIRDPRDCVWSAFVQVFAPNSAMVQTGTVVGTADLYAATMEVWRRARRLPGLLFEEVHYEAIVSDVEAAARQMIAHVGEPWDDRVLHYRSQLGNQTVRTPSFAAIARPVSTRRIGRWQRYASAMQPVLPVLEPFIELWDYPSSAELLANRP